MDLHRREIELLDDGGVLDLLGLVDALALDPLGGEGGRGDGGAAAEGLELGVLDDAVVVDLDLKTHDIAAGGRTDKAGAHLLVVLVEGADVARVFVVIDDFFAVGHGGCLFRAD